VSERAQDRTIMLPLYPQMTEQEQERVVAALKHALEKSAEQRAVSVRR
jgi:dTDP-4-amino-4,6-dideoxygalactose transaminase